MFVLCFSLLFCYLCFTKVRAESLRLHTTMEQSIGVTNNDNYSCYVTNNAITASQVLEPIRVITDSGYDGTMVSCR